MAAITKRLLHVRPNSHSYARPHPFPVHHFSSSSDSDARPDLPQPDPNPVAQTRSPLSSTLSDVRTRLYQQSQPQNRQQTPRTPPPSTAASTDETHRLLSEFRRRSAAPPPSSSGGFSLQELFEKNVNAKGKDSDNPSGFNVGVKRSIEMIRSSLPEHGTGAQNEIVGKVYNRWSKFQLRENLKLKADANANLGSTILPGGMEGFLPSFLRMDLGLMRDHQELGNTLKKLRPENRKGKWFSLQELSDRVAKLKEAEKKEREAIASPLVGLRAGIAKQGEKEKHPLQTLGYLGILGGTQTYDLSPPKNDLVEKYFHPDNMSSAEKLKLELKKVRDEFKMSESDCGSARVQVAQLTTKIKHLSTVLKKKDKHSRRGLQAMVQRRKKLLKYLRRTDWDSYCLVLSKFGFRDNPDIKA
ncbi:hypothetical protein ACS0TY_020770 [Phlomoides rotata]